jgi:DNA-binding response OmpR family regulator
MSGLKKPYASMCRKVKHHVPASICIAITGHASVFDLVSCREAGFDDYYEKPIPFDTLREVVGNAVATIGRWKTVAIDSEAEPAIQL